MIAVSTNNLILGAYEEGKEMYSHHCKSVWNERSYRKLRVCLWVWNCVCESVCWGEVHVQREVSLGGEEKEGNNDRAVCSSRHSSPLCDHCHTWTFPLVTLTWVNWKVSCWTRQFWGGGVFTCGWWGQGELIYAAQGGGEWGPERLLDFVEIVPLSLNEYQCHGNLPPPRTLSCSTCCRAAVPCAAGWRDTGGWRWPAVTNEEQTGLEDILNFRNSSPGCSWFSFYTPSTFSPETRGEKWDRRAGNPVRVSISLSHLSGEGDHYLELVLSFLFKEKYWYMTPNKIYAFIPGPGVWTLYFPVPFFVVEIQMGNLPFEASALFFIFVLEGKGVYTCFFSCLDTYVSACDSQVPPQESLCVRGGGRAWRGGPVREEGGRALATRWLQGTVQRGLGRGLWEGVRKGWGGEGALPLRRWHLCWHLRPTCQESPAT